MQFRPKALWRAPSLAACSSSQGLSTIVSGCHLSSASRQSARRVNTDIGHRKDLYFCCHPKGPPRAPSEKRGRSRFRALRVGRSLGRWAQFIFTPSRAHGPAWLEEARGRHRPRRCPKAKNARPGPPPGSRCASSGWHDDVI